MGIMWGLISLLTRTTETHFGGTNLNNGITMMLEMREMPRKIHDILTFRKLSS